MITASDFALYQCMPNRFEVTEDRKYIIQACSVLLHYTPGHITGLFYRLDAFAYTSSMHLERSRAHLVLTNKREARAGPHALLGRAVG
jgi:hypothetical protein